MLRTIWRALYFTGKWSLVTLGAGALFFHFARTWNTPTAIAILGGPFVFGVMDYFWSGTSPGASTPQRPSRGR